MHVHNEVKYMSTNRYKNVIHYAILLCPGVAKAPRNIEWTSNSPTYSSSTIPPISWVAEGGVDLNKKDIGTGNEPSFLLQSNMCTLVRNIFLLFYYFGHSVFWKSTLSLILDGKTGVSRTFCYLQPFAGLKVLFIPYCAVKGRGKI